MTRAIGEVVFTLTNLVVATYNILTDTVGTAVVLPEPQKLDIKFVADNDQIMAAGRITHLLSVFTHATFTLSSAGIPFEALATIASLNRSSSGSTPNQINKAKYAGGGAGLPYFAIAGKMMGENSDDLHVGLVCCKLDQMPGWTIEQNKFLIGEATGKAIQPDSRSYLVYAEAHETAADINLTTLFA